MEPPFCGPLKRARAANSAQVPACLVDGCNSDLSKCRDYHRRHKVCELHSKTPKVTIRGQEQRFCQQCSRFHSLGKFDDVKRSCRKRLDGHNRRRRKAQPDPSISSSHLLTSIQGSAFIPFSSPQIFPATALESCPWNEFLKSESDSVFYSGNIGHHQLNFTDRKSVFSITTTSAPSHSYKPQIQFPFMQGSTDLRIGSSVCGTSLDPNTMSGNSNGCSSQKILPNFLIEPLSSSSECALSLLSSSLPASSQASHHHKDGGTTMQFDLQEPPRSMPTLHYSRMGADEPTSSFLQATGGLNGMFQMGNDGSGSSQSHHTPSFTWE
ncbi:hypothetical protein SAY86_008402 [Trapa natans]|uniref:SBP-type domain-containing protein n=1 Tax=Trapa natans TaxID=22666 RepID=A0AAN7QB24_TRANT|nr:hypothetical protein SAY86_008402 [Trapa natans]